MKNVEQAIIDATFEEDKKENDLEGFLFKRGVLEDIFNHDDLSEDDIDYKYEFEEEKIEDGGKH